jgi:hypothetical protein
VVGCTLKIGAIILYLFLQQITLYNFSGSHLNDIFILPKAVKLY